ncbi:MAG: hypothetical protein KDD36_14385 [Flavobacteriales bacterium]|nr:hypothetical protein [Flavobacteriales bacterium]
MKKTTLKGMGWGSALLLFCILRKTWILTLNAAISRTDQVYKVGWAVPDTLQNLETRTLVWIKLFSTILLVTIIWFCGRSLLSIISANPRLLAITDRIYVICLGIASVLYVTYVASSCGLTGAGTFAIQLMEFLQSPLPFMLLIPWALFFMKEGSNQRA